MESKAKTTAKARQLSPAKSATDEGLVPSGESGEDLVALNLIEDDGQGPGVPDDDFELLPLSKLAKEKLVKEKAVKVKGAVRQRIPGGGRRIKEIEDPAVAKKLSRFSSAAPSKIVEEGKPNHLSSSSARKSTKDEQDVKTLPTKPSRFSSSRKSSRRPHIRKKIKDAASDEENVSSSPEEKSSKP